MDLYSAGLLNKDSGFTDCLDKLKCSADAGSVGAATKLGNLYYNGTGVKRDYIEAAMWYDKAALLKNRWCMNRLSEMKQDGKIS